MTSFPEVGRELKGMQELIMRTGGKSIPDTVVGPVQELLWIAIADTILNTHCVQGSMCINSFHPQNCPI